jgi:hypothetical protein
MTQSFETSPTNIALPEETKEAIRRVLACNNHQPMNVDLPDWKIYSRVWQELKNYMCRRSGVDGAITARMVSDELSRLSVRRVSRYRRDPVI